MIRPPSFHSGRPAPGFAEFSIKFLPCRYSRSQGKRKKTGAHCRNAGESGLGSQGMLSGKAWEFVRAHSNQSAPSTGASRRPHPTSLGGWTDHHGTPHRVHILYPAAKSSVFSECSANSQVFTADAHCALCSALALSWAVPGGARVGWACEKGCGSLKCHSPVWLCLWKRTGQVTR